MVVQKKLNRPLHPNEKQKKIGNKTITSTYLQNIKWSVSSLNNDLPWLNVAEPINKLNVTVHLCLLDKALRYLVDCCTPVSKVAGRRQRCSASRQHLTVSLRYRLSTFGRRDFSVAGPTSWNYLPDRLCSLWSNAWFPALRFRNPYPHCRSVAPLPCTHHGPNGYTVKIEIDPIWMDDHKRRTYGNGECYFFT